MEQGKQQGGCASLRLACTMRSKLRALASIKVLPEATLLLADVTIRSVAWLPLVYVHTILEKVQSE